MQRDFGRGVHWLFNKICALDNVNAGALHFRNGILHIVGSEIYAPAGVFDQMCLEAHLNRVQRRELHAVIRRQPADENLRDTLFLEPFAEAGGLAVAVVKQAAVAVDANIRAFGKHLGDVLAV